MSDAFDFGRLAALTDFDEHANLKRHVAALCFMIAGRGFYFGYFEKPCCIRGFPGLLHLTTYLIADDAIARLRPILQSLWAINDKAEKYLMDSRGNAIRFEITVFTFDGTVVLYLDGERQD